MTPDRRSFLALGAALPLLASSAFAAEPAKVPVDAARAWRRLFAGPDGEIFAWWSQGLMLAHVDGLREFPVMGHHSITICRTNAGKDGTGLDVRTIGYFSDIDSGLPTATWDNPFTGKNQAVPTFFVEGPGRYNMAPRGGDLAVTLASTNTRTNRVLTTATSTEGLVMLTQVEGTLQGFPNVDGSLPPLGDPAITERQTRLQFVAPLAALDGGPVNPRGLYNHVYDALPPWMGFGERLGSGLYKGVMRRAGAAEIVNAAGWAHLKKHVPSAFAGNRLVLA